MIKLTRDKRIEPDEKSTGYRGLKRKEKRRKLGEDREKIRKRQTIKEF